jgi:hypothetical protein
VDSAGHATVEPIDFLKDQKLQKLEVASLDHIVTCDVDTAIDGAEIDLKYYRHKVLAQTFRLQNIFGVMWMVLLPEKNFLMVGAGTKNSKLRIIRFDLNSGAQKELIMGSKEGTEGGYRVIMLKPLWDPVAGNLLVYVEDDKENFWAQLNPDDLTLTATVPIKRKLGTIIIDNLLSYERAKSSIICHGVVGDWPLYTYHGTYGFYEVSMVTGQSKLILSDDGMMPFQPMDPRTNIAVMNRRYVVMTRARDSGSDPIPNVDPHTFLIDLQTQGVQKLDMPYVTWPISQEGLHVESGSPATPSAN